MNICVEIGFVVKLQSLHDMLTHNIFVYLVSISEFIHVLKMDP